MLFKAGCMPMGAGPSSSTDCKKGKKRPPVPKSICLGCSTLINLLDLPVHAHLCLQQRPALRRLLSPPPPPSPAASPATPTPIESLAPCQQRALRNVSVRACALSTAAMGPLLARSRAMGYTDAELHSALTFIRERAPLVIHIHVPRVLSALVKDTHYRSLFETGTSSGSTSKVSREEWEGVMFSGAYAGAAAAHRCKYGVLNPTGDARGVVAAKNYGSSFLVLKDHVRLRITCASKDTGGGGVALGTPEHYAHVLAEFSDTDFRAVLGTLKTGRPATPGEASQTYKEMQVHGDIVLARDVEALVLTGAGTQDPEAVELATEFGRRFSVAVIMS